MRRFARRINDWRKRNPELAAIAFLAIVGLVVAAYKLFINPAPEVPYTTGWSREGSFNQAHAAEGQWIIVAVICLMALWVVAEITRGRATRQRRRLQRLRQTPHASPLRLNPDAHQSSRRVRRPQCREAFDKRLDPEGAAQSKSFEELLRDWPITPYRIR